MEGEIKKNNQLLKTVNEEIERLKLETANYQTLFLKQEGENRALEERVEELKKSNQKYWIIIVVLTLLFCFSLLYNFFHFYKIVKKKTTNITT